MKRLPAVLAATLLATAPAALLAERADQGTVEIGGNLFYDTDTPSNGRLDLGLLGGYFVADGWLIGGEFSLLDDDNTSLLSFSAVLERDFEVGTANTVTPVLPYVGVSLGYASAEYHGFDDESGAVLGLRAGLKVMLTGSLALDLSGRIDLASSDIYLDDNGPSSTDITLRIGLRTFLF